MQFHKSTFPIIYSRAGNFCEVNNIFVNYTDLQTFTVKMYISQTFCEGQLSDADNNNDNSEALCFPFVVAVNNLADGRYK